MMRIVVFNGVTVGEGEIIDVLVVSLKGVSVEIVDVIVVLVDEVGKAVVFWKVVVNSVTVEGKVVDVMDRVFVVEPGVSAEVDVVRIVVIIELVVIVLVAEVSTVAVANDVVVSTVVFVTAVVKVQRVVVRSIVVLEIDVSLTVVDFLVVKLEVLLNDVEDVVGDDLLVVIVVVVFVERIAVVVDVPE